jgi:diguanylate cyclase (GGDEF)-like protein
VLYCDLDNFKAYNDHQGFVQGDRLIQATARMIQDAVLEYAGPEGFVGHVGGDDFVAVLPPEGATECAQRIVTQFREGVKDFYAREDLERGYVEVLDRRGEQQKSPLVAISIGVASTERRLFSHYVEAVNVATEMKQYAKRQTGSSFAIDRRTPSSDDPGEEPLVSGP